MTAHQHDVAVSQRFRERDAKCTIADQQVGRIAREFANLETGGAVAQKTAHMRNRPKLGAFDGAERHDRRRMAVNDRGYVGPRTIDLAVNEALQIDAA